jgi:hypothetical protein
MKQEEFYRTLSEVPQVPASIFPGIEQAIRRAHTRSSRIRALAACFILAAGITSIALYSGKGVSPSDKSVLTATVRSDELLDELQTINQFINGSTLSDEMESYSLVSLEL